MASKDKPSKTLYHSELVSRGIVELQITGIPTASKFAGKPDFVGVILDGEERLLNLENESIKEFFSGQKGQRFHVKASGGKGNASIQFVEMADDPGQDGDNSNPDLVPEMPAASAAPITLNPPKLPIAQKGTATAPGAQSAPLTHAPAQGSAAPRPAPAAAQPDYSKEREMIERTCKEAIRLRNVVKLAFVNALKLKREIEDEWPGEKISETQLQGFVGTLAIQLFRDGAQRGMPARSVAMRESGNGHHAPPEPAPFNPQDDIADSFDDGGRE